MAKKQTTIARIGFIILLATIFLGACIADSEDIGIPATDFVATASATPVSSPTLAAPVISVSTNETAVPQPSKTPIPKESVVTETAVSPTETPAIIHPTVPPPTPVGSNVWNLRVPILMYHYISEPPPDADIYRIDLSVPPEKFREQMAYLAKNGYTPIDLYQLSAAVTAQIELPEKPIVLTFDDGYLDNYENAFPILQEFGFIGTFFVITDLADQGAEGYANWEQLKEMAAAGMRIESHTKNHPDLSTMGRADIIFQALGSQETIAAHIGYMPRYLCYPGGRYDEETMQILSELDMWGAVTTQGGGWHGFADRYEWSRQRMRYETTMDQFRILIDPDGTVGGKPVAGN